MKGTTMMDADLVIRSDRITTKISVGGYVSARTASAFGQVLTRDVRTLASGMSAIELDLFDLELSDGTAVAEAVNALRDLAAELPLNIANAPQMLAHTLYKTGLLAAGRMSLTTPQQEQGPSS